MVWNRRAASVTFGAACCLAAALAWAQTAPQPSPPPQICVNGQCVSSTPPTGGSPPSPHSIKWHPGHYMDSYAVIRPGTSISKLTGEMRDLDNQNAVLGYRVNVTWSALESSQGTYDFSLLDAVLAQLKTAYNAPKRLVIYVWLYNNGSLGQSDDSAVPLYIQQTAAYGASPVGGSYGWWGKNANGASAGMYAPALYYPPVMDRLIAMVQALGQHYDSDPNVEAIDFQEDATIAQCANASGNPDPHYSDDAWLGQLERLLSATTAAFPHTNVIMDNTWFVHPNAAVALEQWMVNNRIAPGTADSLGESLFDAEGYGRLADGLKTWIGVDSSNGGNVDLRSRGRAMLAVEAPDMFGTYYRKVGGPWTPLDIINAMNKTYYASHVFWTRLSGTETSGGQPVPAAAKWSNLVQTISANPLIHTDYPADYP